MALILALLSLVVILCGCDGAVPAGRILVKNDSQDSTYNQIRVSAAGSSIKLNPGQSSLLPKGARSITFSRAYKDYTRSYQVTCPSELAEGITIKLIDVHTGRLPGGCYTTDAARKK